jgi:peptidoglycan-associated lipoprotein
MDTEGTVRRFLILSGPSLGRGSTDAAATGSTRSEDMTLSTFRTARLAVVLGAALALGACSSDKAADGAAGFGAGGLGAGGAGTPGSTQDFVVNVGDRVFFETDSSDLTPTAIGVLDKQAQWLQRYTGYAITIEGHADERGTREYNFALGARRAQTVRDYLASKGVPANRIKTISFGKERPVAVCDDISCWSQNRRGVTVLGGQAGM